MTKQIDLSLVPGQDGGLVVYENVESENVLAFAGDLEATSKYLTGRMGAIIVDPRVEPAPRASVSRITAREPVAGAPSTRMIDHFRAAE
jgi:hypothetical protein